MCRIGAIKSSDYIHPSQALLLMQSQQKGHDNSGFAMVMHDLGGIFQNYKNLPTLSLACTDEGLKLAEDILHEAGFSRVLQWVPETYPHPNLDIIAMPNYVFETFNYPKHLRKASQKEKEDLLLDMRLKLRFALEEGDQGYVYSFWPDVVTLKEIGDPRDIGTYFNLWEPNDQLTAKVITAQCRQNTNYDIVRYAAHPFFLQGYTALANGENTFYLKNKEMQRKLHRGYIGFESDSQCFLYTLHYVHRELGWPLPYYKHVITPLPFDQVERRDDRDELLAIRQSMTHLEINGPNTIIGVLPDNTLFTCCDAKKLRPVVVGRSANMVAISSEVCGINEIMPERNWQEDIYPNEREVVVVGQDLEVQRWKQ
ncbi:glutamate synthase (NADPH) GltB1 subunit [Geoalkalibacter ferrihydriticus]|uniref:Glutamate synthase n=2 Tax=Geoalkalibacter ferrihydriticus TaxID=392333 RepID=A0A0C2HGI7_9BACT|nr:glutamine amidotransferase family protein [Geoalkalibacter ferrihydriticus]KIH76051.1 glutamate synthase [Geoalkalibacter ferrihydriticus DSM 17813]SDM47982.1 glutamate synthase (NADPH) GltB1 subunit [Geoalkalibacter ferrihydriticus]